MRILIFAAFALGLAGVLVVGAASATAQKADDTLREPSSASNRLSMIPRRTCNARDRPSAPGARAGYALPTAGTGAANTRSSITTGSWVWRVAPRRRRCPCPRWQGRERARADRQPEHVAAPANGPSPGYSGNVSQPARQRRRGPLRNLDSPHDFLIPV